MPWKTTWVPDEAAESFVALWHGTIWGYRISGTPRNPAQNWNTLWGRLGRGGKRAIALRRQYARLRSKPHVRAIFTKRKKKGEWEFPWATIWGGRKKPKHYSSGGRDYAIRTIWGNVYFDGLKLSSSFPGQPQKYVRGAGAKREWCEALEQLITGKVDYLFVEKRRRRRYIERAKPRHNLLRFNFIEGEIEENVLTSEDHRLK